MNLQETAIKHYLKTQVREEIADFCRGRWVALHLADEKGTLLFRRYLHGKPVTIQSLEDFQKLIKNFGQRVRSIYATANVYKFNTQPIAHKPSLDDVIACTPTWDIDNDPTRWRDTIEIAREIVAILEECGIKESTYIKWSGRGCHVHIHERAISPEILKEAHPLDFAYAIVEYVNMKIAEKHSVANLKIENRMDAGRVFTCPLSLHRELNVVCICMKPNDLDNFSLEWIKPDDFRHNPNWRVFITGEADDLAMKAYKLIGGYPLRGGKKERKKKLDEQIIEWLSKS
ncbi:MAG: hypothetical protein QXT06_05570 [Candidatus Bathyarchaeia archaeon]